MLIQNIPGGVLDIFYPEWKMKIAANEALFRMTCQLWKEAYCYSGEKLEDTRCLTTTEDDGIERLSEVCTVECDNYGDRNKHKRAEVLSEDVSFMWHPFGAFDCNKGYMVSV